MSCPKCGSPFFKVKAKSVPQTKVNEFRREEISFTVDYDEFVNWNPATSQYDCRACGCSFSFNEFTLQRVIPKIKQVRLDS